jgi:PAS domain S-box-containing protein
LASEDAIVVGNRAGIVEWANDAWTRMTGRAIDETVHKPVTHFLERANIDRSVLDFVQANFVTGKHCVVELPFESEEAGARWIHLEVDPYRDALGEVSDFVAVATDITERREAELALERHLQASVDDCRGGRQADANRVAMDTAGESQSEALSKLALEATSTGRSLLRLCNHIVTLASSEAPGTGSALRGDGGHAQHIAELGEAAGELANRLILRAEQMEPTPCELDASVIVASCCAALEPDLPRTVRIDAVLELDVPAARSIAGPLIDLLSDLLRSSADNIADGWGTLSITTGSTMPGHALHSPVYRSSFAGTLDDTTPRVFVEIHDTGAALTPDESARLRADVLPVPPPGRVFSLLLARARAAQLGAELHVNSSLGCGTQCLLLLPVA